MKKTGALLLAAFLASGCVGQAADFHGRYEADDVVIEYVVPDARASIFTHVNISPTDGDTRIYVTADAPEGVFGTTPGRRQDILSLLPVSTIAAQLSSIDELSAALKLYASKTANLEGVFAVETVAGRTWVCGVWTEKSSGMATSIVWYSLASTGYVVASSYSFHPGIPKDKLEHEIVNTRSTVAKIIVTLKKPNQPVQTTSVSSPLHV